MVVDPPYVTDGYLKVLRATHANKPWGRSGYRFVPVIAPFYDGLECKSLLDYGSGAESLRNALEVIRPDIDVRCYDPGVVGRDVQPESADFVVCTDVLEHVEKQFVNDVFRHINQLAQRGCFINVALTKAKRVLLDGRNAHITLESWARWISMIRAHPWRVAKYEVRKKSMLVWLLK